MTDIVVISRASFTTVNRAVYRELVKYGWNVEILVPERLDFSGHHKYPDERTPADPPIHQLSLSSDHQRLHTYRGLFRLLKKLNPRVIYLDNDPASRLSVELGLWAKLRGVALVCQSCENQSRRFSTSFSRMGVKGIINAGLIKIFVALARPNIDDVLVINSDGIQVLNELGFAGKVSLIPLGFDADLFYPDMRKRENIRNQLKLDKTTVAYFGMIRRPKGVHLLIEALGNLMDLEWQLLIDEFGLYSDNYQTFIQELIRETGITSRVVFFDAKHEEMPAYMNAADIVVLPSITTAGSKEQYGRVISEAMACGRMVIVSDSGALPELVSDAGLCCRQNDVEALENALREAITKPEMRADLGMRAHKRAHSTLSVAKQAEIMNNIFLKIVGSRLKI
jgi:glycosyltransferase involved in cell wall biosynthesis